MVNMTPVEAYRKCKKENRRIRELEIFILKDPYLSFQYANDIIKGRWKKAEKMISTHPEYSYLYAIYILKSPFHLGHKSIFNSSWINKYINFLKSCNYDMKKIYDQYGEWLI
jgi:hypothetical protein